METKERIGKVVSVDDVKKIVVSTLESVKREAIEKEVKKWFDDIDEG